MGAWGMGFYENDEVMDWSELLVERGPAAISEAIEVVFADDYVDVDAGSIALAAAEALCAANGTGLDDQSAQVITFCDLYPNAGRDLVEKALEAVERVRSEDSEVRELWEEAGHLKGWLRQINDLEDRLRAI